MMSFRGLKNLLQAKVRGRWSLIMFLAILIGLFGYVYRDLFHWNMLCLMDLGPWYHTANESYEAFSSSWTHMGLGNYDSLGPGEFMIMSGLTTLFGGNAAMAQRIFWLSIMPLSAITMRILLGRFTCSNMAKLIIPIAYAVNGITIVWFQIGAFAFFPAFVLFPLLMLYLIKILEEKERRLLNVLIFTLIYGLMANWLLYSLLYFLPFVVIFFLIEIIYHRDRKYTVKTSLLFAGSFGILFLLVAPVGFDQLLNIVGFYTESAGTFGYYTPTPIEDLLEAVQTAYSWEWTVNMITNLTYLLGFSALGTLLVRRRTLLKYYLGLLLVAALIILFAILTNMGLIIDWYAHFPILITFQHPGKLAMMASWSFFGIMAILVSEVEERIAFPHKATL